MQAIDPALIRARAAALGFTFTGITPARFLEEEARHLEQWLHAGRHGEMSYLERYFDVRTDPRKLFEGARSVICLMYNYFTDRKQEDPEAPQISQYAYGKDYHGVIKSRLKELLSFIRDTYGDVQGRCFVDSAPLLERDLARHAGIGWVGKNTLLIHPRAGSWYFLAEIVTDLPILADAPMRDHCGTCRRCIDACPTEAISPQGYVLDASRCISYLTIELRNAIPEAFRGKMDNWMFGCDVCQEVCPWNRFSSRHEEPDFEPHPDLLSMRKSDWIDLTEEVFGEIFRESAVNRTTFQGLKRNIQFLFGDEAT